MEIRFSGATDQSIYFKVVKANGDPATGLADADITEANYARNVATHVSFATSDLALITTAHADGGFKELDATDFPGVYRLDVPDAAFVAGSPFVLVNVILSGDAQMSPKEIGLEIGQAVWNEVIGELAGVPAAAPNMGDLMMWLFMKIRNKSVTDDSGSPAKHQVFDDAGVKIAEADVTDTGVGGAATRAKYT